MSVLGDEQAHGAASGDVRSARESTGEPGGESGGGAGTGARPGWLDTAPVAVELDATAFLSSGEDPFFAIQDAARTVAVGEALVLRAPFAPVPLYGVLARKGFVVHADEAAPDQWVITFYRERAVAPEVDADDTHPHSTVRP